jgi:uncharacterized membrane protein
MGDFNHKFNAFIKTLFDNNYIFYIVALIFLAIWVSSIIANVFIDVAEYMNLYLNLKEKTTTMLINIIATLGMCVLYIAFCNSCYMAEYYNENEVETPIGETLPPTDIANMDTSLLNKKKK